MAQLIIIRGNSGSGKTTVAKELQRRLGCNTMLISQDVIRREMLMVKDGQGTMALPLMEELLRYGRKNSEIVILEGILNADWYLDLFRLAMELYKSDIHAYYYDISFAETLRRHKTKPNCNDFGEDDMLRWWIEEDYIKLIPEEILDEGMSMEKTVELIYQNVIEQT